MSRDGALVAICMATFQPDPPLLERQIDSIRAQKHERFVCLVSDDASPRDSYSVIERACAGDARFLVSRGTDRIGYYRNFERTLSLVPAEADFVAFSDQDDVWHPDKLETLLGALNASGALLAYSDMNIVTRDGRTIGPSYWSDRRNNWTDLGSLILVNTVTGAASLFRRELLEDALPFPRAREDAYHDHWIACLALTLGEIAYVDRPLHDYVQHGRNVVGRHEPLAEDLKGGMLNALRRFVRQPRARLRSTISYSERYYVRDVLSRELFANTLEQRLAGRIAPAKAHQLRLVARMSSSLRSLAWLLSRSARDWRGESATLGIENQLIKGILWHHAQRAKSLARW